MAKRKEGLSRRPELIGTRDRAMLCRGERRPGSPDLVWMRLLSTEQSRPEGHWLSRVWRERGSAGGVCCPASQTLN